MICAENKFHSYLSCRRKLPCWRATGCREFILQHEVRVEISVKFLASANTGCCLAVQLPKITSYFPWGRKYYGRSLGDAAHHLRLRCTSSTQQNIIREDLTELKVVKLEPSGDTVRMIKQCMWCRVWTWKMMWFLPLGNNEPHVNICFGNGRFTITKHHWHCAAMGSIHGKISQILQGCRVR